MLVKRYRHGFISETWKKYFSLKLLCTQSVSWKVFKLKCPRDTKKIIKLCYICQTKKYIGGYIFEPQKNYVELEYDIVNINVMNVIVFLKVT